MSVPHRDDEPDEPGRASDPAGEPVADPAAGPVGDPQVGGEADPAAATGPSGAAEDPHDAAWRAIVENYGERPTWEQPPARPHPEHPAGRGRERRPREDEAAYAGGSRDEPDHDATPEDSDLARGPEERYVPPPPPPLPRTTPIRLAAWFGLLGVPSLVLVTVVVGLRLPPWTDTLFLVWFVGGFVYLVASMRRDQGDHDDPDHGAVV